MPSDAQNADLIAILRRVENVLVTAASDAETCVHVQNPRWAEVAGNLDEALDDVRDLLRSLRPTP